MQPVNLARAKIQAPRFRSGLIERNELEEQLGDALATRRLVMLVAPAGFGKTAALSRQLECLPPGRAVAWLTADDEDDLQRLLFHLIEALEPLDPPWRLAPQALLEGVAHGRMREMATAFVNTLEATGVADGGVIVLDDLHAVADPRVFEFLDELLEGLPQDWTLVVSSRVEPPLALGRWRARREIAEFDETALSFSRREVQALWRHSTGQDDPEQAGRLHDRTLGWAAGLCLSLEAAQRSAASAKVVWHNRRHLFAYLASEVLERLPDELQGFLLRCSLLPELTVARCEQISGNPRAAELLEEIERRRLFISFLESDELTLRLHDLFRDFLEERLHRLHSEEVPLLLRRAAQGEADPVRRTLTLLRAGAWDEALQSVADTTADMLACDEGAQVLRLVEQFPQDIQAGSPVLAYARGLCAWSQFQYAVARSEMTHAAAGFAAKGRTDDAQRARAMQALAAFFHGDMAEARRMGKELRCLPMDLETEALCELLDFWYEGYHGPVHGPGQHLARVVDLLLQGGSAELWFRCLSRVNTFISRPAVSAQIRRMVDGARAAASDRLWSLQASANMMGAWLLLWQGRIAEVEAAFQRIDEDSRWLGQPTGLRVRLLTIKAIHQVICDDTDALRATCHTIAAHASLLERSSDLRLTTLSFATRMSAAMGDWATVRQHLPVLQAEIDSSNASLQLHLRVAQAQLASQDGRTDEALATLREVVATSREFDTLQLDATARTQLALAELAAGSHNAAWQALEPLIKRVTASGDIGQVLGTGARVLAALASASWNGAASEKGLAVLRQWVETARRFKAATQEAPRASASQDAGLSGRELQVLALLAGGQSNKLIARTLDLSPHTVKRHVARILERLDLSSRMQAADWYRSRFGH